MRNQISGLESENQMARSFPNKLNRWARPENESAASRNRSTLCFWFGGDKKKIFSSDSPKQRASRDRLGFPHSPDCCYWIKDVHREATTTEIMFGLLIQCCVYTHSHILTISLDGCLVCKQQSSVCPLTASHEWQWPLFGQVCVDSRSKMSYCSSSQRTSEHNFSRGRKRGQRPAWSHTIIRLNGLMWTTAGSISTESGKWAWLHL